MGKLTVNNLDFAKNQRHLVSKLEVVALKRIEEFLELTDTSDSYVHFELTGDNHTYSHPGLRLKIDAKLPMRCQRCLNVMSVPINLNFDYVLTSDESADLDEIDDVDWLEPSISMDLQELIEDELLIALPIAPMHQEICKQLNTESGEKVNPFAVLKDKFK
ncbi:MAG: YceD family protein [Methylophilus sp.]